MWRERDEVQLRRAEQGAVARAQTLEVQGKHDRAHGGERARARSGRGGDGSGGVLGRRQARARETLGVAGARGELPQRAAWRRRRVAAARRAPRASARSGAGGVCEQVKRGRAAAGARGGRGGRVEQGGDGDGQAQRQRRRAPRQQRGQIQCVLQRRGHQSAFAAAASVHGNGVRSGVCMSIRIRGRGRAPDRAVAARVRGAVEEHGRGGRTGEQRGVAERLDGVCPQRASRGGPRERREECVGAEWRAAGRRKRNQRARRQPARANQGPIQPQQAARLRARPVAFIVIVIGRVDVCARELAQLEERTGTGLDAADNHCKGVVAGQAACDRRGGRVRRLGRRERKRGRVGVSGRARRGGLRRQAQGRHGGSERSKGLHKDALGVDEQSVKV